MILSKPPGSVVRGEKVVDATQRASQLRQGLEESARSHAFKFNAQNTRAAAPITTPPAAGSVNYDEHQRELIAATDRVVIGEAVAGSGKTTTAIGFAAARSKARFLYMSFGRANSDEARRKFGPNVKASTTHAIAFAALGHKYKDRLPKSSSWRPREIAEALGIENQTAACVARTLASFYASTDSEINENHLGNLGNWNLTPVEQSHVLDQARVAWTKIIEPGSNLPVTHDTYLKLWSLSKPRLDYDYIILDEAQDTNPLTEQLVLSQLDHCKLLAIGDRHQSIYGFRGATNAMQNLRSIEGSRVVTMPRTWRFGPKTADIANKLLHNLKDESISIIGMGKDGGWKSQSTLLTRTNAGLFDEAVSRKGIGLHWLGGVGNYNLAIILDAHSLWADARHAVRDPFMKRFRSWSEVVDYAESTRDAETKMLIKVVERYKNDTPKLVDQVIKNEVRDAAAANMVLTTAHKAKGMEWDCVRIGNDFNFLFEAEEEFCTEGCLAQETQQEVNLLYVAITRARQMCMLNDETQEWLKELPKLQADRLRLAAMGAQESVRTP
ncbi:MAG: ATP-dependent helicase [Burkholderiaceae bacterium]|nr:MAG: ATP-dependent helicase [Burkholderiaceae bacterium]TBR76753.1 MAG: ATP-dependent helicase [Burkholderiaceae bacterium]